MKVKSTITRLNYLGSNKKIIVHTILYNLIYSIMKLKYLLQMYFIYIFYLVLKLYIFQTNLEIPPYIIGMFVSFYCLCY